MEKRGRWELVPGGRPLTDLLEFKARRRRREMRVLGGYALIMVGVLALIMAFLTKTVFLIIGLGLALTVYRLFATLKSAIELEGETYTRDIGNNSRNP